MPVAAFFFSRVEDAIEVRKGALQRLGGRVGIDGWISDKSLGQITQAIRAEADRPWCKPSTSTSRYPISTACENADAGGRALRALGRYRLKGRKSSTGSGPGTFIAGCWFNHRTYAQRSDHMADRSGKLAGVADEVAGKAKELAGRATGSKELEAEGRVQEARGSAEYHRSNETQTVNRGWNDHTVLIVGAILILTVVVQVLLVKSWT